MKRSFTLLILALSSVQLFAQGNPAPKITTVKADTVTVYPVAEYERSRFDGLLLQMKDFEITPDGLIYHQGKLIKTIKVNGQSFSRLDTRRALTIFPSNMIHNIEILDVQNQKTGETERQLNIVNKKNRKDQFADIMVGEGIVRSIYMLPMSQMRMDDIADAQYAIYAPRSLTFGVNVNDFGDPIPPLWARQAQGFNDQTAKRPRGRGKKAISDPLTGQ